MRPHSAEYGEGEPPECHGANGAQQRPGKHDAGNREGDPQRHRCDGGKVAAAVDGQRSIVGQFRGRGCTAGSPGGVHRGKEGQNPLQHSRQ